MLVSISDFWKRLLKSLEKAQDAILDILHPLKKLLKQLRGQKITDPVKKQLLWKETSKVLTHDDWYSVQVLNEVRQDANRCETFTIKQRSTSQNLKAQASDDEDNYGYDYDSDGY